jgi:hypothetical protein
MTRQGAGTWLSQGRGNGRFKQNTKVERWEDRDCRRRVDGLECIAAAFACRLPCGIIERGSSASIPNADFEVSGSSHKHTLMHCSGVDIHGSWSLGFEYLLVRILVGSRIWFKGTGVSGVDALPLEGNDYG